MQNFTKIHQLPVSGHADIDFIDIPVDTDVPFFTDIDRIFASPGFVAELAKQRLNDFFQTLANYAQKRDYDGMYQLLSYGHEPNETHLGLSRYSSRGRGVTPEILQPIIKEMLDKNLFEAGLVSNLSDLHLLTPNFGPDRLSDLTTNIIREVLHAFTRSQYETWNIPYDATKLVYRMPIWDMNSHHWRTLKAPEFLTLGRPTLLIPKSFVGTTLLSSPAQLLQKWALAYGQQFHLQVCSALCKQYKNSHGDNVVRKPSKEDVRRHELQNRSAKEYIFEQVLTHPQMLPSYHQAVSKLAQSSDIFLSDTHLDYLLYHRFAKII